MNTALQPMEAFLKKNHFLNRDRVASQLDDLFLYLSEDAGGRYIEFDTECICDVTDYQALISGYKKICGPADDVELLSADYDHDTQRAGMSIRVNGVEFKEAWTQQEDWVSNEFFALMSKAESVLRGRFVQFPFDQIYRALYITDQQLADELRALVEELLASDYE